MGRKPIDSKKLKKAITIRIEQQKMLKLEKKGDIRQEIDKAIDKHIKED